MKNNAPGGVQCNFDNQKLFLPISTISNPISVTLLISRVNFKLSQIAEFFINSINYSKMFAIPVCTLFQMDFQFLDGPIANLLQSVFVLSSSVEGGIARR